MNIPVIRKDLVDISKRVRASGLHMEADELIDIADAMKRRRPLRRAAATSTPMTPQIAEKIRKIARRNPEWSQQRIADMFNVNPGRVSEALRGKRGAR